MDSKLQTKSVKQRRCILIRTIYMADTGDIAGWDRPQLFSSSKSESAVLGRVDKSEKLQWMNLLWLLNAITRDAA